MKFHEFTEELMTLMTEGEIDTDSILHVKDNSGKLKPVDGFYVGEDGKIFIK